MTYRPAAEPCVEGDAWRGREGEGGMHGGYCKEEDDEEVKAGGG